MKGVWLVPLGIFITFVAVFNLAMQPDEDISFRHPMPTIECTNVFQVLQSTEYNISNELVYIRMSTTLVQVFHEDACSD